MAVEAVCTVKTSGKTGVEMEALTGVNVALLTIYDMCKAMDRGMTMTDITPDEGWREEQPLPERRSAYEDENGRTIGATSAFP